MTFPNFRFFGNVLRYQVTFLPKTKMVRVVHMNIFYRMDLEIYDSKSELWTKTEKSENQKSENPKIEKSRISNIVILSFTTKSGAPDRPIRSVSSSEYRRIRPGPKLTTFLGQNRYIL